VTVPVTVSVSVMVTVGVDAVSDEAGFNAFGASPTVVLEMPVVVVATVLCVVT